jgi:hypothetical protein
MPNDALDIELRHTIRLCWKSLDGQKAFKQVSVLPELVEWGYSAESQITTPWSCGDSAGRICGLLVGETLGNHLTASDAIDLTDHNRVAEALQAMKDTLGCIVVRINLLGGHSGHSYAYLGRNREAKTERLTGQIYQTNVGCNQPSWFNLLDWINDEKHSQVIDLEEHFEEIGHLQGAEKDDSRLPSTYQKHYMLSTKKLTETEIAEKKNPSDKQGPAKFRFMWRAVNLNNARERLKQLRDPLE